LVNEKTSVAAIGNAVNRTNPISHGAMNRYPQRARRQANPDMRGRPSERATPGAATT